MLSPKSHAFLNSGYANIARQLGHAGDPFVLINPADAQSRRINHGSAIDVFNARGTFAARAEISDEVMPGVIVAPMGYWMSHSRSNSTVSAVNPNKFADLGRAPTFSDNLVEIRTAG